MPTTRPLPASLREHVFRGTDVVRRGLLTPAQLRGPACRRLFRDVYVDARVPDSHRLRARAAARLLVPGAVVSGRSAAVLWGVDLADERDDVELLLPPGSHPRRIPRVRVRRTSLDPGDVRVLDRVRVVSPLSATLRASALLPPDDAVVVIDRMVAAGVVDLAELRARAAAPGAASSRVRRACARADGLAESPQETRLRLLMVDGLLPAPVAQYVVRHEGREVARVDFAWPERRLAVEYDGAWHAEPGQFARPSAAQPAAGRGLDRRLRHRRRPAPTRAAPRHHPCGARPMTACARIALETPSCSRCVHTARSGAGVRASRCA